MSASIEKNRANLYKILGKLPAKKRVVFSKKISQKKTEKYIIETLSLDLNGLEKTPAYFLKPLGAKGKLPTILYCHSHGGLYKLGKDELINGNPYYMLQTPHADDFIKLNCNILCIDSWCFGERSTAPEADTFKRFIWQGSSLWGMMVYDYMKAIDYLGTRKDVDMKRLAVFGMSMGGSMSWWLGALDKRIKVIIDVCSMTEYQSFIKHNNYRYHALYYYVPALLTEFSTASINSLTVPRAHLSLNGSQDVLTPPEGLALVDKEMKKLYKTAKHPENWKMSVYKSPHKERPGMRKEALKFLKEKL